MSHNFNKEDIMTLLAQNPLQGTITGPGAFQPTGAGAAGGGTALASFVSVFLGFFTIIGGLTFLMYFVFAALSWITAGGDKGKVESSKTQMTNGAIGMIVVILAQFIIGIVSSVLGLKILDPVSALMGLWN
jgi:hypothetical protein